MSYLIASIIAVMFFGIYLWAYKEQREHFLKNFVIYIFILIIAGAIFFKDGITAKAFEVYQPEGLVSRLDAEEYVIAEFDKTDVLYSWYGFVNFRPVIIVMATQDNHRRRVVVDAFSGKLMDSNGFIPNDKNSPTVAEKLRQIEAERLKNELEEKALKEEEERRQQAAVDAYLAKQKAEALRLQRLAAQNAAQQSNPIPASTPAPDPTPVVVAPTPAPTPAPVPAPTKKPQTRTRTS